LRKAKDKNKKLTKWEKEFLTCKSCGSTYSTEGGLQRHKTRAHHWSAKPDKAMQERVEAARKEAFKQLIAPDLPSTVEVESSAASVQPESPNTEKVLKKMVDKAMKDRHRNIYLKTQELETVARLAEKIPVLSEEDKSELRKELYISDLVEKEKKETFIDPVVCGIKAVHPGTVLRLLGRVLVKSPDNSFTYTDIDSPTVGLVSRRWADAQDVIYLDVSTDDGVFVVSELLVIPVFGESQIKILQYGEHKDLYTKKSIGTDAESLKFYNALNHYYEAQDRYESAKKHWDWVKYQTGYIIKDYLEEYGLPLAEGGKDRLIKDSGFEAYYSYEEGRTKPMVRTDALIATLKNKGLRHLMKTEYVVDEQLWRDLKKRGVFTEDEIEMLEYKKTLKPVRDLTVKRIDAVKEGE
jgi:hypothetical protein